MRDGKRYHHPYCTAFHDARAVGIVGGTPSDPILYNGTWGDFGDPLPRRIVFPTLVDGPRAFCCCIAWVNEGNEAVVPMGSCFVQQGGALQPVPLCPACYYVAMIYAEVAHRYGSEYAVDLLLGEATAGRLRFRQESN